MNTADLEIVTSRANPLIDPTLHIWGWEIPVYLFLGGIVAGMMVLLPALELSTGKKPATRALQWAPFVALGLLSAGMGALFLDLANKLHVFRFYLTFEPTSPMSWGSWVLIAVYPVVALIGLGGLDAQGRAWLGTLPMLGGGLGGKLLAGAFAWADEHRRGLLLSGAALGVVLGTYTGLLLGTMVARIPWNSAVLGPLFLVSGVSTGAAFLLLLPLEDAARHKLVRWDTLAIGVELFLLALLLLGFASGNAAGGAAASAFMGGSYTHVFWALVVITGLLVPLAMNLLEMGRGLPHTAMGPVLVLIGGLALRAVMVAAGQNMGFASLL